MNNTENVTHVPEDCVIEESTKEVTAVEIVGDSELEPGIANPELADYRVELSINATFQELVDKARFDFGDSVADKIIAEILFQTQQSDEFSFDSRILEMEELYESPDDAEYWLPVIFG